MMFPGMQMDPTWMAWWGIGSMVLWAGLVILGVVLVTRLVRPERTDGSAKRILDQRLAKGEIDAEEYRSRRALLEG